MLFQVEFLNEYCLCPELIEDTQNKAVRAVHAGIPLSRNGISDKQD